MVIYIILRTNISVYIYFSEYTVKKFNQNILIRYITHADESQDIHIYIIYNLNQTHISLISGRRFISEIIIV